MGKYFLIISLCIHYDGIPDPGEGNNLDYIEEAETSGQQDFQVHVYVYFMSFEKNACFHRHVFSRDDLKLIKEMLATKWP